MHCDIIRLEQNTPEWLAWRNGGIGGSDAPAIMGVSPWATPLSLWQERLGRIPRKEGNWATDRGHELEPIARALLEAETGLMFEPLCGQHKKVPWLRASFDGVSLCRQYLGEIKCPGAKDHGLAKGSFGFEDGLDSPEEEHRKALAGIIPTKYWPQLQHQLLVAGLNKTFYASYRPEDKDKPLAIVEVYADREYQRQLVGTEERWWKCLIEQRLPVAAEELARGLAWRQLKLLAEQYAAMAEDAQKALLMAVGYDSQQPQIMKRDIGFAKMSSFSVKGEVNIDALLTHLGVDLSIKDAFRGPESVRVRLTKTNQTRAKATEADFFRENPSGTRH